MNKVAEQDYNNFQIRLLEMIAHDVKAPLDSLAQLLSILKGKRLDDAEYTVFFESVDSHVKSSCNLMQELLNWARIRQAGMDDEYDCVSIKSINTEIIQSLEYFTSEKNISIWDHTAKDFKIFVSVNLYRFIVRNLLVNGIKFSHARQKVHIKSCYNNDNLEVTVSDTGLGISDDKLNKIGNPICPIFPKPNVPFSASFISSVIKPETIVKLDRHQYFN